MKAAGLTKAQLWKNFSGAIEDPTATPKKNGLNSKENLQKLRRETSPQAKGNNKRKRQEKSQNGVTSILKKARYTNKTSSSPQSPSSPQKAKQTKTQLDPTSKPTHSRRRNKTKRRQKEGDQEPSDKSRR